jgi:hypothetical protein
MYRFYTEIEIKGFDSIVKNFILSDQAPLHEDVLL